MACSCVSRPSELELMIYRLENFRPFSVHSRMSLDASTLFNLEILANQQDHQVKVRECELVCGCGLRLMLLHAD